VSTDYDTSGPAVTSSRLTLEDVARGGPRRAAKAGHSKGRDRCSLAGRHRSGLGPGALRRPPRPSRRARARKPIHLAEDRGAFRPGPTPRAGLTAPRHGHRHHRDRGGQYRPPRSATRCWYGHSYVLGGRGMEIVYDDATPAVRTWPGQPNVQSRPPGADRPVPRTTRSRSDRRPRSTTGPSSTSAGSWSTSRRPASIPGTPPARCPPITIGRGDVAPGPGGHRGDRPAASACAGC